MDGTKADGGKVAQATQPAGSKAGESGGAAAKPLDPPAEASGCGDEVDDEQVERFYALLANMRAIRGVCIPGGGETAAGGSGVRKRLRGADEPQWRPAFRLEDFNDDATATWRSAKKKEGSQGDGDEKEECPVVASPSVSEPPPREGARWLDGDTKGV